MTSAPQDSFQPSQSQKDQGQAVKLVLGLLAAVLAALCLYFFASEAEPAKSSTAALITELPPYWGWLETGAATSESTAGTRPVFAYSVIPGGVSNAAELKVALDRDPIAATHYAGFRVKAARAARVDVPRQVYVSYRLGNHIFWTSKTVTLPVGETVLSDGTHLVRARCGNRISTDPLKPTSAHEPPESTLSAPVIPQPIAAAVNLPPPPPIWSERPTPFMLALSSPPLTTGSSGFAPPPAFFPCCGGSSTPHTPPPIPPPVIPPTGPPSTPPSPPPPVAPPVRAPEGGTMVTLIAGLAAVFLVAKLRRS